MIEVKVDREKKVLILTASGFVTPDEGLKGIEEYKKGVASINPVDYTLIVNCTELKTSTPNVADMLQGLMQMYMSVPFRRRIGTKFQSAVTNSQVQRLGRSIPGFNFEWVDTFDDALKLL